MAITHPITAEQKLTKAKSSLILDFPFFGMLALKLRYKEDTDGRLPCPSAGVDGITLWWDRGFIDALSIEQTAGLLAHEILHCGFAHHVRRFGRHPMKWNVACDYAIDPIVEASGLKLPDLEYMGQEYRPHIKDEFKNMSADHIYALLPDPITISVSFSGNGEDENEGEGQNQGQGEGEGQNQGQGEYKNQGAGHVFDSPNMGNGDNDSPDQEGSPGSGVSREQMESMARHESLDWKLSMNQAAQVAKQQGKLPGMLQELIEELNEPQVNWIAVLRLFMTDIRRDDYIWSRPNRRHITNDIYFPMRHSEGMGEIVIAVDTSGSISKEELIQFSSELNSILDDVKPSTVHVLYADTHVRHTEEFKPEDWPVKLHKHGGGGTDFSDPFYWTRDHATNPACLIYLTDGYGGCSAPEPGYPVLWVCTSKEKDFAPFGQVLPLEIS